MSFFIKASAQEDAAISIVHALDRVNFPKDNLVNHVNRDSAHNLWICSNNGVYKYTGYNITRYLMHEGLGDNLVFGSFEDSQHRIWFRTYNGKVSYYYKGKIHNRINDSLCRKLDFNSIIIAIDERNGKIVFASQADGLRILEKDRVSAIDIKVIKQFYWESDSILKIITAVGIYDYNLNSKEINCKIPLDWGSKYTSVVSKNDNTLVTNGSDVYSLKKNQLTFLFSVAYPKHEIISIEQYDNEHYILGTRNGIVIYNTTSNNVEVKYFGKSVPCVNRDAKDQFWMSIEDHGAFYVRKLVDLNINIKKIQDISCLYKDKNRNIWVGTKTGSVIKILPDGTERHFDFSTYAHRKDKITQIFESPDNQIIIIDKLFISAIKDDKIAMVKPIGGNEACLDEANNTLWIRSIQLSKFKFEKGILSNRNNLGIDKKFNGLSYYQGRVYGATNQEFGEIIEDSFIVYSRVENIITDINEKYVLTNFGTIYEITAEGLKKLPFQPPAKLTCDKLIINGKKLYICTNQGLFVYDTRNHVTRYVKSFRGLAISDIVVDERYAYLGTSYALYKVPLSFLFIGENSNEIRIEFTNLLANKTEINHFDRVQIPYADRELTVNFSVKSYFLQPTIFYKIDEREWVKTKNFYIPTNLEPGIHKVFLYVKMDETPKLAGAKVLSFEILKPFWQTWWFSLFFIVLVSTVFYALYLYWTNRLKIKYKLIQEEENKKYEKLALENEIILLEQKALRMQMNPHFIFNAINTFKGFYAENNERDGSKYINNFSKLLRNILENESFINPLSKEIEIAENYLKMMQVKYPNLTYQLEMNHLEINKIGLPSMILQPFVENAIIHGIGPHKGKGHVKIELNLEKENRIKIKIEDNGKGLINSNSIHQSKSFGITSKRLKIFNQKEPFDLTLSNSNNGQGAVLLIDTIYKKL